MVKPQYRQRPFFDHRKRLIAGNLGLFLLFLANFLAMD